MAAVDQSAVNKHNCDVTAVLICQHNMDCIKTEPEPVLQGNIATGRAAR
jgi:hypothetical protein